MKTTIEKIEKLIIDGQKELIGQIQGVENEITGIKQELGGIKQELGGIKQELGDVKQELKRIDKNQDVNAQAVYGLLQDTRKELNDKIDEHMRQPAHV